MGVLCLVAWCVAISVFLKFQVNISIGLSYNSAPITGFPLTATLVHTAACLDWRKRSLTVLSELPTVMVLNSEIAKIAVILGEAVQFVVSGPMS
jgi:hypothetical protein